MSHFSNILYGEDDYPMLILILKHFSNKPSIPDWKQGGALIQDFICIRKAVHNILFEPVSSFSTRQSAQRVLMGYDLAKEIPDLMSRITRFMCSNQVEGCIQLSRIESVYGQPVKESVEVCFEDMMTKLSRLFTKYEQIQQYATVSHFDSLLITHHSSLLTTKLVSIISIITSSSSLKGVHSILDFSGMYLSKSERIARYGLMSDEFN